MSSASRPLRHQCNLLARRPLASGYPLLYTPRRPFSQSRCAPETANTSRLPRILQRETWQYILPKSLRTRFTSLRSKQGYNPYTYFVWIYILIGSQAMRIIGLQNDHNTYMRKAEVQIAKLREVIRKLQAGEPVDVEKSLGTGDEAQEREWEEAMREIENQDFVHDTTQKQRAAERKRRAAAEQDASPVNEETAVKETDPQIQKVPGFY